MIKRLTPFRLILIIIISLSQTTVAQNRVIKLGWEDIVQKSLNDNLGLKTTALDYKSQKLTKWQAVSDFLPTVSYNGTGTQNLELATMAIMGQKIQIGTEYNFQHSLQLTYPVFTGFSRIANLKMQNSLEKSLKAELEGKEDETILTALQAYFQIMLSSKLIDVNEEAVKAAQANLKQVQNFYQVGAASELDLKRAEAQYSSTLPSLESAKNQLISSKNQMKYILNLSLNDSLVVLDSLESKQFIGSYANAPLVQLKALAVANRPELKQVNYQVDAIKNQKTMALSSSLPTISFTADISHNAMTETSKVLRDDYNRSKSINLNVQWPLFQGGKTALEYQKAKVQVKQMEYVKQQTNDQILIQVEQYYYSLKESIKNLSSLKASLDQAKEALRLSSLMYKEGMSTQVDILDTQLQYTQSNINFQQGIYDYNTSQLNLLKSIGKINTIIN